MYNWRSLFHSTDGKDQFPLVLVGGVLEGNKKWDISGEVIKCISKVFPGVCPIRPEVSMITNIRCYEVYFINHCNSLEIEHSEALDSLVCVQF